MDLVARRALQFARVLDDDEPVARRRRCGLGEQRVDERRLAGTGAADDQHDLALAHCGFEEGAVPAREYSAGNVLVEGEDPRGLLADDKGWRRLRRRRHECLNAATVQRQLTLKGWVAAIDGLSEGRCDRRDDVLDFDRRHPQLGLSHSPG